MFTAKQMSATATRMRKADAPARVQTPPLHDFTRIAESAHDETPNISTIGTAVIQHGFLLRANHKVAVSRVSDASNWFVEANRVQSCLEVSGV